MHACMHTYMHARHTWMNICTSLSRALCAISPCDVVPERLQQRHMLALALTLCIGRFSTAGGQQAAGDCRGSQLPVPKVAESVLVPGHDFGSDGQIKTSPTPMLQFEVVS